MANQTCYPCTDCPCCLHCDRRKILAISENGKKLTIQNRSKHEYCLIKVDNCLIANGERCDYLVIDCDLPTCFLVELKGHDLQKAIKQINATIGKLHKQLAKYKSLNVIIILSRAPTPDVNSNSEIKLKMLLRERFGGTYHRKNLTLDLEI